MNPCRILTVDDEEDICEILRFNLEIEGYKVDVAHSAEDALKRDISGYNLILLDVMMDQMSGFKMAHILRENPRTAETPIIFISAKNTENDRLTGFNLGAEDYILKPFSMRELVARINAVLRRITKNRPPEVPINELGYRTLKMILDKKKVYIDNNEVHLTKKEFELLKLLLENKNTVLSRIDILTQVWHNEVIVLDRTIDVNVTRLRKKLGKYGNHIITRLGYGYCFEE